MATLRFPVALAVIVAVSLVAAAAAMGVQSGSEMVPVIVTLREQADLTQPAPAADRSTRLRSVVLALRGTAERAQQPLRALLEDRRSQGSVERFTPFWIFDGVAVTATPAVIDELSRRHDVASIVPDRTIAAPAAQPAAAQPETNIALVKAPALWALGYRGQGVVVASMDTGVDVSHPELGVRWRGGTNSWFDPNGEHTSPADVNGHGTWTTGVMVGGDAGGSAIGIAPEATWIAVKIFDDRGTATTSGIHAGFQWLLDPDGDPVTPDAANVVNNSWALSGPSCSLEFEQDLRSLRAAGILPVFAAGNYGPGASTSASPANNPGAFAVGATDNTDAVDPSSGRGPSACGEPPATFPELVAPGVDVHTTDLHGLYTSQTGTSLAAPHVAGAVALLLSAFPDMSADEQALALEGGAADLGEPGPDSDYGYGRLDVLAAYESIAPRADFAVAVSPDSVSDLPGQSVRFAVSVTPRNGFTGDVELSLSGLAPSQASWRFSPQAIAGGSGVSQLLVTLAPSLAPGTYPLTVTATSGRLAHSTTMSLVIRVAPDFSISVSPAARTVSRSGRAIYSVTVSPVGGFTGSTALSVSGLPGAASAAFSPPSVTGAGSSNLTVQTSTRTPRGTFTLTVTGRSGGIVRKATATLTVK